MKKLTTLTLIFFITMTLFAQDARVIGYLPTYRFSVSNQIDYCKLTHLNLSFANPDSAGNIVMAPINAVVTDALNDNPDIIIMISLAGAGLTAQQASDWSNLIDNPANRPAFIAKIVNYVISNNLDGVDVDLEWDHVTSGYSDFVIELDAALDVHGKMITAALPNQTLFSNITTAALDAFDFINIMSYDGTGPWNPSSPGQHSSYAFSQNGIDFWNNTVGIAGDRLNLGLPFYGYDFVNSTTVNAVTYSQMVASNTSYADMDNVGNAYYNGRPTMESKIELANNLVGGVLIWEIGQDAFNEYSLLETIHSKYTSLGVITSGLCGNSLSVEDLSGSRKIEIYPNPTSNDITIANLKTRQGYVIYNIIGEKVMEGNIVEMERINVRKLKGGMYFIKFENGASVKLIKQ